MTNIPDYEDLPEIAGTGERHAWDVWGRGDSLGSVNRLTPERVKAGVSAVRHGLVVGLDLPLTEPRPSLRPPMEYVPVTYKDARDDYLNSFYLQGSSQLDGLGHQAFPGGDGWWGGRGEEAVDAQEIGIHHWAGHGLVGRGVLIDLPRFAADAGIEDFSVDSRVALDGDLITRIARAESVDLEGADFLLLHTGWLRRSFMAGSEEDRATMIQDFLQREMPCPGLDGKRETVAWLWDHGVVGVLADNFTVEALPVDRADGFQHRRIIPLVGMVLGELMDLERLSEACAEHRQYDFMVTMAPLNIPGAVGSPSNAYAIL